MWFSNRAQLNCGSTVSLSQPPQIVVPPPPTVHHTTGAIASKPHHICRFFSPRFCFGVARRPLTCDCKLSWQSDIFLLYMKVGLVPTVWKVLTNFWQSVVNFPNPGTWSGPAAAAFCNSPLSFSAPNCSSVFSQLQPWFQIFIYQLAGEAQFFRSRIVRKLIQVTSEHVYAHRWKCTHLWSLEWYWHFEIDISNIWPNFGRNPVETLQDDDYHIFGLAVLGLTSGWFC